MSQKNKLLKELVRRSLEILAALMAIPNIAVVDERALLKYKFCQNDNYDEKPMEIALLIRLFPRVCAELERDRRFHALCSELDADSRFRKLTMPDGTIIPGTEVLLGNGILISVLWRYLNLTKQLTWNQSAVACEGRTEGRFGFAVGGSQRCICHSALQAGSWVVSA